MRRSLPRHALATLTHPVVVLSALVLLLNATLFQPIWPGWLTGKIGDLAWLIVAPALAAVVLAVLLPRQASRRTLATLVVGLVGAAFVIVKTFAPANMAVASAYTALTGLPAKLALDPSDLLMLPGLVVAWRLLAHANRAPSALRRPRQAIAVGLAALALLADSAAPQNLGIVCLVADSGGIVAVSQLNSYAYFDNRTNYTFYRSSDSGATWQTFTADAKNPPCTQPARGTIWVIHENKTAPVQYMLSSGAGIYRSADGGASFTRELELRTSYYDALFDPATGMLLVAAGSEGVAIRGVDGVWQVVNPGESQNQ